MRKGRFYIWWEWKCPTTLNAFSSSSNWYEVKIVLCLLFFFFFLPRTPPHRAADLSNSPKIIHFGWIKQFCTSWNKIFIVQFHSANDRFSDYFIAITSIPLRRQDPPSVFMIISSHTIWWWKLMISIQLCLTGKPVTKQMGQRSLRLTSCNEMNKYLLLNIFTRNKQKSHTIHTER